MTLLERHSCARCARRKVRCDRASPSCANCYRTRSECIYRPPATSFRHRRRPPDDQLLARIRDYERLLHEHRVSFRPLDSAWVPAQSPQSQLQSQSQPQDLPSPTPRAEAASFWWNLPRVLRDCPIDQLGPARTVEGGLTETERATETETEIDNAASLLLPVRLIPPVRLLERHPEPRLIFRLWQTFADAVHPLTKVVHAPSLQQRIAEVSGCLEAIPRPLEAVMFAIYALAVAAMRPPDCLRVLGEHRSVLLHRYASCAAQALIAAEMHSTKDLEVLQALVLFLLIEPHSELSLTVLAVATRIGQKMGLHRTPGTEDGDLPFFEQEMRLRVWWQLTSLEWRAWKRAFGLPTTGSLTFPPSAHNFSLEAVAEGAATSPRLPLNVNDTDLHPHMTSRAISATSAATDMVYVLVRYETLRYARAWNASLAASASAGEGQDANADADTEKAGLARKRQVIIEVADMLETRYLLHCDAGIPLHRLATVSARMTVHRLRFWCFHPRQRPPRQHHQDQDHGRDQDLAFESSLRLLQLRRDACATVAAALFSGPLLQHLDLGRRIEMDALVYVLGELVRRGRLARHQMLLQKRGERRGGGGGGAKSSWEKDLVKEAWDVLGRTYAECPHLTEASSRDGDFAAALADLALQAWETWEPEEPAGEEHAQESALRVPEFVGRLKEMRTTAAGFDNNADAPMAGQALAGDDSFMGWVQDDRLDWACWNDLLQL